MKLFQLFKYPLIFNLLVLSFSACANFDLKVHNGSGTGSYAVSELVSIEAEEAPEGMIFDMWKGGSGSVTDVYAPSTHLTMPSDSISIWASYRSKESTGIDDIDQMRSEVSKSKTNEKNAYIRRSTLYRWWRLLWRQGVDLSSFDQVANDLLKFSDQQKEGRNAITEGFAVLEKIHQNPTYIENVEGKDETTNSSKTDWPVYYGTNKAQNGYSPDAGPSKGVIKWAFAKGYYWDAKPVIELGKVYVSSPGIDVAAYCLNEKTGAVEWKGRQYGTHFYSVHGTRWDPVVTKNYVTVRTENGQKNIKVFDKFSGNAILKDDIKNPPGETFAYTYKGKSIALANAATGNNKWQYDGEEYFSGQPLKVKGNIFANTRNGTVMAFSYKSNTPTWKLDLNEPLRGTPSMGDKLLFVSSKNGKLFAINPEKGSLVWTFETKVKEAKSEQFFSAVFETRDRIYVGATNKFLYCLSVNDGQVIWRRKLSDWIRSRPLVMDDFIYAATMDSRLFVIREDDTKTMDFGVTQLGKHGVTSDLVGNKNGILVATRDLVLYSVSPYTGNVQWKHSIVDAARVGKKFYTADWNGGLMGSPTVVNGTIYIGGCDGFVNAVDAETGKEKWRFETSSTTSQAPTVVDGKVYFGYLGGTTEHFAYDRGGEYFALNKDTGEPVWTTEEYGKIWVSATFHNNKIYFGNVHGHFFAVNKDTGEKIWSFDSSEGTPSADMPKDTEFRHGYPPGVYSVPASDATYVYSGSWAGNYFALDLETGKTLWSTTTGNQKQMGGLPDSAAPTLWKGYLYVQKLGGMIAAINIKTGKIEWEWYAPAGYLQNATIGAKGDQIFASVVKRVIEIPFSSSMISFSDMESGMKKLWEFPGIGGLTAPVLTDDKLVSGSSTSMFITCLNPDNGKLKWRVFTGGEMLENAPAIYGDKVYAYCKNGYLFCIE